MKLEDILLGIIVINREIMSTGDIIYSLTFQPQNNVTGIVYVNISTLVAGPVSSASTEVKEFLFKNRHAFLLAAVFHEIAYSFQENWFFKATPSVNVLQ